MSCILVIDDDDLARFTTQRMLEGAGHRVVTAENGVKGIAAFREHDVDLVITDIIMPEKEGIETIIELRGAKPYLKIIAISGGGRTGNLDFLSLARQIGADRTLSKPFGPRDLLAAVDACYAEACAERRANY